MPKLLVYSVPKSLKIIANSLALTFVGEFGQVLLNEDKFVVFIKKGQLVVCSSCVCYASAKIVNAIKGALSGHIRWLLLNGIGYKAFVTSNGLELSLGISHRLMFKLTRGVEAAVIKTNKLKLKSTSLAVVASTASALMSKRRADVYKAKGIIARKLRKVGSLKRD
ncbi:MAG: hypothetical protein AAI978_00715 [Candidatus Hodgkinia cicadicola]